MSFAKLLLTVLMLTSLPSLIHPKKLPTSGLLQWAVNGT
jgi:hypothetical protein